MSDRIAVPNGPNLPGLCWRRFRGAEDLAGLLVVRQRCAAHDGVDPLSVVQRVPNRADLERTMVASERFDPAQDVLVVALQDGIVGYGSVQWWTETDGTNLYLLLGWLVPEWRNRGIGTAMLQWGEARCRALAAAHPPRGEAFFGANASATERDATALLLNNGYRAPFTVLEMGLDDLSHLPHAPLPPGFLTRPLRAEDLPLLFDSMNGCYANHPFSEVPDYAGWADKQDNLTSWHVAWDAQSGEMAAQVQVLQRGGLVELEEVSVRAPHRRKGLARALIVRGLEASRQSGVTQARLRTVAENPQQAWRLYESLGFRVLKRFPRYRKPMS